MPQLNIYPYLDRSPRDLGARSGTSSLPESSKLTGTFTLAGRVFLRGTLLSIAVGLLILCFFGIVSFGANDDENTQAFLPNPVLTVSTVPPNGDGNPYGVAFVPADFPQGGVLKPGDILVSNFNNSNNLQGTGTTIVRIGQDGKQSVFFQGKSPLGLSTALSILRSGFVLVGNFPTADGSCATAQPGSLLILNASGHEVGSLKDPSIIDGPWDMTVNDLGGRVQAFISNVLDGSVVRLDLMASRAGLSLERATKIASGYSHRCDPAALVVGPTGLVYTQRGEDRGSGDRDRAAHDVLYVASTEDNAIFRVTDAGELKSDQGRGEIIYQDQHHLHGPLALALAPNGHLLTSNSDVINPDPNQPSEIVEFTISGRFVKELSVDPNFGGSFGLAVARVGTNEKFAAVDDNANNISIYTLPGSGRQGDSNAGEP